MKISIKNSRYTNGMKKKFKIKNNAIKKQMGRNKLNNYN